jgi:hypothetical protein
VSERDATNPPILDPVVEQALKHLTAFVFRRRRIYNLRLERREKSLADPSARAGAIHIFKHLKHHGYHLGPNEIRVWASVHGWSARDAQELGDYAAGVVAGRRYHTLPDPFGMDAIEDWRADAAASGDG